MSESDKKPDSVGRVAVQRMSPEQLVLNDDFLKRCPAVKALGVESATTLLKLGTPRRFRPGAKICAGDTGGVLLLVRGEARLLTENGAEIAVVQRGEFLGDVGVGMAEGEVDVLDLPAAAVQSAATDCKPFAQLLESVKAGRKKTSSELDDFMNRW